MGLPSGLKWADCDIDLSQGDKFAKSPFQYEKSFFSWGNTDGHNPLNVEEFDYNWGGINNTPPYYDEQVYGSTSGCTLSSNIELPQDAARINLGNPWRIPTIEEFKDLLDNCDFVKEDGTTVINSNDKRVTVNGVKGIYLKSKINGNLLFFSCSGIGTQMEWQNRTSEVNYWSSSYYNERSANALHVDNTSNSMYRKSYRYHGIAIRPVQ